MGFWGIEVKPGKPYPYHSDNVPGRLHVTQATLGLGSSTERSIVQCSIGHKSPIFLCSLLPNKDESCPLNLEFDDDDLVAFSVIGPRSVYLSGYFEAIEGDGIRDDYESDSYEEDIAETESGSSDYGSDYGSGDEYDDEFDDDGDDDFVMFPPSPVRNSGVVIEEIVDDEKPTNGNGQSKRQKKKNQANSSEDKKNSQNQIVVRGETAIPVLESEDEDGFPISTNHESKSNFKNPEAEAKSTDDKKEKTKKKKAQDGDDGNNLKRKVESIDQEGHPEKEKKKKKKKQLKGQVRDENSDEEQPEELKSYNLNQASMKTDEHEEKLASEKILDGEMRQVPSETQPEEKKKKKKKNQKKNQDIKEGTTADQTVTAQEDKNRSTSDSEQKQTDAKSSKVRTFSNGLVIEELAMGKPDGERASPGKQVSVRYIGKLRKNGKIFDSNVGRAPFKFRLGVGQVIKGWDIGVNGMRVGDKRRLTIPPAMGYGSKGAGGKIPPNSWLIFDVELINVR
ncbi:peptidyl-prolyl cis-trans isomerase FKBP53 [Morus notabilis]|uniref:peptidyl-prolyl cis-trans isomerase FKBP53 n=1 Tax=Morus notabilis TaxID=981085 RepID=UPI000CED21E7|nr:peptidyl-prolyl cis-trans isomerase FKBP53 [Morus notabilis]